MDNGTTPPPVHPTFARLPVELQTAALSYLPLIDQYKHLRTCTRWHAILRRIISLQTYEPFEAYDHHDHDCTCDRTGPWPYEDVFVEYCPDRRSVSQHGKLLTRSPCKRLNYPPKIHRLFGSSIDEILFCQSHGGLSLLLKNGSDVAVTPVLIPVPPFSQGYDADSLTIWNEPVFSFSAIEQSALDIPLMEVTVCIKEMMLFDGRSWYLGHRGHRDAYAYGTNGVPSVAVVLQILIATIASYLAMSSRHIPVMFSVAVSVRRAGVGLMRFQPWLERIAKGRMIVIGGDHLV